MCGLTLLHACFFSPLCAGSAWRRRRQEQAGKKDRKTHPGLGLEQHHCRVMILLFALEKIARWCKLARFGHVERVENEKTSGETYLLNFTSKGVVMVRSNKSESIPTLSLKPADLRRSICRHVLLPTCTYLRLRLPSISLAVFRSTEKVKRLSLLRWHT